MKTIIAILVTAVLSFAVCLYLPWWSITLAAFVVAVLLVQKPWLAFLNAFIALLLLWGGMAWGISIANKHLLAQKLSILIVNNNNPYLLILLTGLIGALVAGFAALTGTLLRRLF